MRNFIYFTQIKLIIQKYIRLVRNKNFILHFILCV